MSSIVKRGGPYRPRVPSGVVLLLLVACGDHIIPSRAASDGTLATDVASLRLAVSPEVPENSAAAASALQPGVLFTINDSGNDAMLFAFDTAGGDRGRWRLRGAVNRDWEAVAVGPCPAPSVTNGAVPRWCVFVGDVGDNGFERDTVVIYRVEEPQALPAGGLGELTVDSLLVSYPDSPHNVEAMYVAADGGLHLLPKEAIRRDSGGRRVTRPTLVYRVDPSAWGSGMVARATLVDSLPIVPRSAPRRSVTDASLTPDGAYLAVRTYGEVYVFATDSATGRPHPGVRPAVCNITRLDEAQGEGVGWVAWRGATGRLVLTTEGRSEPLRLATCPLPGH